MFYIFIEIGIKIYYGNQINKIDHAVIQPEFEYPWIKPFYPNFIDMFA